MPTERVYALDFLRACMMLLGILFHGLAFEPQIGFLDEQSNEHVFTFLREVLHTFRMPMFFCLSGFFSSLLFEKQGLHNFLNNRLRRLFIPLVLSMLVVGFLTNIFYHGLVLSEAGMTAATAFKTSISLEHFNFNDFELVHLWFLYYLVLFIPAILLIDYSAKRWFASHIVFNASIRNHKINRFLTILLLAVIPTVILFLSNNNGNPTPRSFSPTPANFLPYFYYFGMGWFFHQSRLNLSYFKFKPWLFLTLALTFTFARLFLWSSLGQQNLVLILIPYNLSLWCYIFGFLGLAQLFFRSQSEVLKYLSEASYWIYLIHYPIILLLKLFFYDAMSITSFIMTIALVFILCIITYNYLVRPTKVGKLLSGRTFQPYSFHRLFILRTIVLRLRRSFLNV